MQFIDIHDGGKITVHLVRVNKLQLHYLALSFPNILNNPLVM